MADLFDRAAEALRRSPWRQHSVERLPARGHLLVSGDLHDNQNHLTKLVRLAKLRRSSDHHLLLQELIHGDALVNGLDFSYRMLAQVASLVADHPGQVHPILANHELAQMTGRSVSKGAAKRVELFDEALEFDFAERWQIVRGAIGRFIAAMPIALRSESGLMCSHSLPDAERMRRFDAALLDRALTDLDYLGPGGSAYELVWGRQYTEETVAQLAAQWGVKLFCVGHNHARHGIDLRCGSVIVLNSDHSAGRALPLDLARLPSPQQALQMSVSLTAHSAVQAEVRPAGAA